MKGKNDIEHFGYELLYYLSVKRNVYVSKEDWKISDQFVQLLVMVTKRMTN